MSEAKIYEQFSTIFCGILSSSHVVIRNTNGALSINEKRMKGFKF